MTAKITGVKFVKEYDGKFGTQYLFIISYDGKEGLYYSKQKDQTVFVKGQDAEFSETHKVNKRNEEYISIKPPAKAGSSNYGRALQKEQSRYTTMGASYVKDLIIAGKVEIKDWASATEKIVRFMHKLDKEIEK